MADKIVLADQIAEVGREIGLRRNVYPRFVSVGKMTQEEAGHMKVRLEAVYTTLVWLRDNRALVLAARAGGSVLPAAADSV